MTPSSVENPPFAMLSRIVGPVAGVSPAAARGAATSTSRLCFRSATMLLTMIRTSGDAPMWCTHARVFYAPYRHAMPAGSISVAILPHAHVAALQNDHSGRQPGKRATKPYAAL